MRLRGWTTFVGGITHLGPHDQTNRYDVLWPGPPRLRHCTSQPVVYLHEIEQKLTADVPAIMVMGRPLSGPFAANIFKARGESGSAESNWSLMSLDCVISVWISPHSMCRMQIPGGESGMPPHISPRKGVSVARRWSSAKLLLCALVGIPLAMATVVLTLSAATPAASPPSTEAAL
jgi:hypothetical protein